MNSPRNAQSHASGVVANSTASATATDAARRRSTTTEARDDIVAQTEEERPDLLAPPRGHPRRNAASASRRSSADPSAAPAPVSGRDEHAPSAAAASTAIAAHTPATREASRTRADGCFGRCGAMAPETRGASRRSSPRRRRARRTEAVPTGNTRTRRRPPRGGGPARFRVDRNHTVDPERDKSDAESFPAHAPSRGAAARATADTNTASAAHSRLRHVAACDQCVLASSSEKSTPPTGAPNAAASRRPPRAEEVPPVRVVVERVEPPAAMREHSYLPRAQARDAPPTHQRASGPAGAPDATASAA